MPDRDTPPTADPGAADRLVDDMKLFLRGGPVPDTAADGPDGPRDVTQSWEFGSATGEPGAWTPSPAGQDTAADRVIGPYRVIRFVAHGGMGDVYHARHRVLAREVALKTVRARFAGDPGVLERFEVEAKAVENLTHPHVVKLFEFDKHAGGPYLAMEWVPGGDLSDRLAAGPLPPREAAGLVRAVAAAMAYAHGRGVLHRDLKPRNVLLTADGTPKVADFGLARLRTDDAGGGLTQTGAILGTPAYMAPEQAGGHAADVRTDVYALGAILYEVLTAAPPFRGDSKEAVLKQVRESAPPRPSSLTAGLPADLEVICLRCLSKDAADRYQTAGELVADLDRFLNGEPLVRSPWRRLRRAARAVRKRWRLLAVAALVGAGGAGAVLWQPRPEPTDAERSASARAALTAKLDAGEPVVLLPEVGPPPAGFTVRAGDDRTQAAASPDGVFRVSSWATGVVEMIPDPARDRYRLQVRVRHEQSDTAGEVGVFASGRTFRGPGRVPNGWAAAVGLNDIWSPASVARTRLPPVADTAADLEAHPNMVKSGILTWGESLPGQPWEAGPNLRGGAPFRPQARPGTVWRTLDLVVTPDGVSSTLDGVPAGKVTSAELRAAVADRVADSDARFPDAAWAGVEPAFAPRGGVGVYVRRGTAAFRDVVIEPLPPTP